MGDTGSDPEDGDVAEIRDDSDDLDGTDGVTDAQDPSDTEVRSDIPERADIERVRRRAVVVAGLAAAAMVVTVASTLWVSAARTSTGASGGNQPGPRSNGAAATTAAVSMTRTTSGHAPLGVPVGATSKPEKIEVTGATAESKSGADGGDTTSADPKGPDATPPTSQLPATITMPTGGLFAFGTPSGNIRCQTADGILTCVIVSFDYAAPPGTCAGEVSELSPGQILQLAKEPGFGCHAPPRSVEQILLPYGHAIQNDRYRCRSEVSGVTCTDRQSGIGLQISRGAYHWLG